MTRLVDRNGHEHGLMNTLINQVSKAEAYKKVDAKRKEELEARVKKNSVMKKVRYIHLKNQENGNRCTDYYAGPGEPIRVYKFLHDNVYDVPQGLIDKVNSEQSKLPARAESLDDSGRPRTKDGFATRIDMFVSDIS